MSRERNRGRQRSGNKNNPYLLRQKRIERMMKDGEALEKIARYVPSLSLDELKELETKVMQLA